MWHFENKLTGKSKFINWSFFFLFCHAALYLNKKIFEEGITIFGSLYLLYKKNLFKFFLQTALSSSYNFSRYNLKMITIHFTYPVSLITKIIADNKIFYSIRPSVIWSVALKLCDRNEVRAEFNFVDNCNQINWKLFAGKCVQSIIKYLWFSDNTNVQ